MIKDIKEEEKKAFSMVENVPIADVKKVGQSLKEKTEISNEKNPQNGISSKSDIGLYNGIPIENDSTILFLCSVIYVLVGLPGN